MTCFSKDETAFRKPLKETLCKISDSYHFDVATVSPNLQRSYIKPIKGS